MTKNVYNIMTKWKMYNYEGAEPKNDVGC